MNEPTLYLLAIGGGWAMFLWAGNRAFGPFPSQYRPIERKLDDFGTAITRLTVAFHRFGEAVERASEAMLDVVRSALFPVRPGDIIDVDGRWHVVLEVSADGTALTTKRASPWLRFKLWCIDFFERTKEWWNQ